MGVLVKVLPRLEQREVRLRLAEFVEPNWALHRNDSALADRLHERMGRLLTVPW